MIKSFYTGAQPEYKYVVKIAGVDKEYASDLISSFFAEYKILDLDVKMTPIQMYPGEFPNLRNLPVVILKVKTAFPVSADYAKQVFCRENGISEAYVIFRSEESPLEVQKNLDLLKKKLMAKGALLSTKPDYKPEEQVDNAQDMVGTLYTNKLLQVMQKLRKETPVEFKVDAPAPLFSWLEFNKFSDLGPKQDTSDFNQKGKTGNIADTLNSGANKTE